VQKARQVIKRAAEQRFERAQWSDAVELPAAHRVGVAGCKKAAETRGVCLALISDNILLWAAAFVLVPSLGYASRRTPSVSILHLLLIGFVGPLSGLVPNCERLFLYKMSRR
jgi:hypothetical protein